jgi:VanZ family protein
VKNHPSSGRWSAILSFAVLIALALPDPARALPADKLSHFATGVPAGALATVVVDRFAPEYRLVGGALLGTVPGLIVEIVDSTGSAGFSGGDLLADFIGSVTGALLTDQVVLRFFFDRGPQEDYGVEVETKF